eukprot:3835759-Pleurochrysis_carterae.AAC.7
MSGMPSPSKSPVATMRAPFEENVIWRFFENPAASPELRYQATCDKDASRQQDEAAPREDETARSLTHSEVAARKTT